MSVVLLLLLLPPVITAPQEVSAEACLRQLLRCLSVKRAGLLNVQSSCELAASLSADALCLRKRLCRYIGLLPPDSSAAPLPAELPVREGVEKVVDLHAMSCDDIMAAARATAFIDPFAAGLPEPPGVRRRRQAFMTGAFSTPAAVYIATRVRCGAAGRLS